MTNLSNIKTSSKHTLIKINPLTIIIVFLSLIFGRFNYIFIHYIIALFHEICHVLTAKIFKIKVNSISFLPFGFYAKMDELEKEKPMRQLLVIIMGPLSFFPVWLILNILRFNFILSSYRYDFAFTSALTVMLFILIPLYPLDGARAIEIIVAIKLDEYKTRIIRVIISIISLMFLTYYCLKESQFIVLIFLFISVIYEIIFFRKNYILFLLKRLCEKNTRSLKIVRDYKIYRYRKCKLIKNNTAIEEPEIIRRIITNTKKDTN